MIHLHKIEFYITNVCNLTCEDCNRFNDYNFKGWQAWNDYADIYAQWSKLITIEQPVILGGEPLLNPTVMEWVDGIHQYWGSHIQILTNGSRINQTKGLYQRMKEFKCWIGLSLHNNDDVEYILGEVDQLLSAPIVRSVGKENTKGIADIKFTDANNVDVFAWYQTEFTKSSIFRNAAGNLTLHQSDPETAHKVCAFAQNKNYHFIRGKLYKCGPVALFPEFDQQFHLDISDGDRDLINSYRPLTLENFDEYHKEFFTELDNPIPQCKFCPASNAFKTIHPILKKQNK